MFLLPTFSFSMALPLHILYIYKETDVFVPRRVYCALQYVPNGMAWCAVWCLTYGESRSTLCQYSSTWSLCAEISVYFSGNDGYFIAWCLCRVHGAESCVHGENVCPPSMMFVPCARCRDLNARGKCLPPYSMMFVPCMYCTRCYIVCAGGRIIYRLGKLRSSSLYPGCTKLNIPRHTVHINIHNTQCATVHINIHNTQGATVHINIHNTQGGTIHINIHNTQGATVHAPAPASEPIYCTGTILQQFLTNVKYNSLSISTIPELLQFLADVL